MSDAPAATPAKATKKKAAAKPKKPSAHPKWSEMISAAIKELKEKKGSSRQAIMKYIKANYKVADTKLEVSHLKKALKAGVSNGTLSQCKGTGASGSFKMGEKAKKPAAPKAKKPKAKKPKAAAAKKPAGEKKAKKQKAKKAKTPKKAAAKPKKASKSPKKAKAAKPKAKKAAKPKKAAAKK